MITIFTYFKNPVSFLSDFFVAILINKIKRPCRSSGGVYEIKIDWSDLPFPISWSQHVNEKLSAWIVSIWVRWPSRSNHLTILIFLKGHERSECFHQESLQEKEIIDGRWGWPCQIQRTILDYSSHFWRKHSSFSQDSVVTKQSKIVQLDSHSR